MYVLRKLTKIFNNIRIDDFKKLHIKKKKKSNFTNEKIERIVGLNGKIAGKDSLRAYN